MLIQLPILPKTDLFPMHFLEISVPKKELTQSGQKLPKIQQTGRNGSGWNMIQIIRTLSVSKRHQQLLPRSTHLDMVLSITNPNDSVGTGNWHMLTLKIKKGYASVYVDGTLDGTASWFHPGRKSITGLGLGRGIIGTYNNGPDCTVDEATSFGMLPVPQTGSPQVIITKSQTQII